MAFRIIIAYLILFLKAIVIYIIICNFNGLLLFLTTRVQGGKFRAMTQRGRASSPKIRMRMSFDYSRAHLDVPCSSRRPMHAIRNAIRICDHSIIDNRQRLLHLAKPDKNI